MMRIDSGLSANLIADSGSAVKRVQNGSSASAESAVKLHDARRHSDGLTVARIQSQLAAVPELRSERVEALRQAIGEGRYKIDYARVGDAIYRELQAWRRS